MELTPEEKKLIKIDVPEDLKEHLNKYPFDMLSLGLLYREFRVIFLNAGFEEKLGELNKIDNEKVYKQLNRWKKYTAGESSIRDSLEILFENFEEKVREFVKWVISEFGLGKKGEEDIFQFDSYVGEFNI